MKQGIRGKSERKKKCIHTVVFPNCQFKTLANNVCVDFFFLFFFQSQPEKGYFLAYETNA